MGSHWRHRNIMKKLLAGACVGALLFAASLVPHNPLLSGHPLLAMPITMGMLCPASESTAKTLTYIGTASGSASSLTASFDLGTIHSKKEVFILATNTGGFTVTAASTTVGGTAVTKDGEFTAASNCVAVCRLSTPTAAGSTSITVSWGGSSGAAFYVYVVVNRVSRGSGPTDSDSVTVIGGTSGNIALTTIASGGMWLACGSKSAGTAFSGPSSLSAVSNSGGSTRFAWSRAFTGTGTTPSDTWSWTTAANSRMGSWAYGA